MNEMLDSPAGDSYMDQPTNMPGLECRCPSHHEHGPQGAAGCAICTPGLNAIEDTPPQPKPEELTHEQLIELVTHHTVVLGEIAEHLAILRTVVLLMLTQASLDEVDQTLEGNPWKKLRGEYRQMMNPHIRALNTLLGIKAEDAKTENTVVVATA